MKLNREKKGIPKLNLIPILDSVFIFIFFLLMSTQFVQTHEIGTEAPSIRSTDIPHKKDPLNLIVNIEANQIVLTTGLSEKIYKTIPMKSDKKYDLDIFKQALNEIKKTNKDETSIVFKPEKKVKYENIVSLMDAARGDEAEGNKLFTEVAFSPAM